MKLTEAQKENLQSRRKIKLCPNCQSQKIALNVNTINLPSLLIVNGEVDTRDHASIDSAMFQCTDCGYQMFFSL